MKSFPLRVLCACLALLCCLCALALAEYALPVAEIPKYGNLILASSGSDFLALGYDYGDVLSVRIAQAEYAMPVCSSYNDVDSGSPVCRVLIDSETGEDTVTLAICMGDLATDAGLAQKTITSEAPGYRWDYAPGIPQPAHVQIGLLENGGYAGEYQLRQLTRTNAREDYAHLGDEAFANFRAIATTGMGEGVLYRTSSPVNPELGRSAYADAALAAAGVRTVINLADTPQELSAHPGFAETAYARRDVIALGLSVDVQGQAFQEGFAEGMRFLIAHEGPYAIHCMEGKDRAGFVSLMLECLMGASWQEAERDYMTTFYNYYGVESGTQQYALLADSGARAMLQGAFGIDDPASADLAAHAEAYFRDQLGLSSEEIAALKARLRGE